MPKPLELTVQDAMGEITRLSKASLQGGVSVHSSVFRHALVDRTYVNLDNSGMLVAKQFGNVKIPVLSEEQHGIAYQTASLLNGQLRVQKTAGDRFVRYSLKGDVDNKFKRRWFGIGIQLYHYSYEVKATFVVETSPAYSIA